MDLASSLPVEIIRRILGMSVDAVDDKYVRLEALATVCHQWRDTILGDGMLWNDVRVTTAATNGQVSTLLRRSARCTLSLDIKGDLDSKSIACAELAIEQYQRVVHLSIVLDTDAWPLEITRRLTDASLWPELQYLALMHHPKDVDQNSILKLRVNAPHLHSIVLYRIDVPNWSTLGEALPNLQNISVEWITSTASLLPVLPRFSALRDLKLLIPHETLGADLTPSFSLPHLHSLEIDAMELRADLLTAIVSSSSPKLASLSVRFHAIDLRQGRIELSAPALKDLRIEYTSVASADLPIPIYFRVVPHALINLDLFGVTDDIAAMAGPSLRKLYLAYTDVDVQSLSSALSHCQHVDRLEFTGLRCTSAIALNPPAIAVLPRLTYAMLARRLGAGEPLDEEVQRLFVRLVPPTVVQMYIIGKPCPSADDLRFVLEDIERLAAPTNLSLGITDGEYFTLTEHLRAYKRMFEIESGAEYLEILLSRPAFCAHIRQLEVEVAHATQILSHCAGSLPLLEKLRIFYPTERNYPSNKAEIRRSLEDLVESVPSPITCPKFKTLRIQVYDSCVPYRVLSPVALGRALVSLFVSQEEVHFESSDSLEWLEW
ncbi:hypothetical protein EXIGLDRAFT_839476 [Exidia glandulosa HHB12029]|uniref:F-box domain-containing protein n=1 Tax=Exidia glandulosa HHB12029 TaxID=1314781 RepID=A0A165F103_EXIGL|nr:hypothetical protein EXIGLDRAFT_839476 [Exidia glandulosa HHB12029]